MSLLIKALEQAEQDKLDHSDGLSLAPLDTAEGLQVPAGQNPPQAALSSNPHQKEQQAASTLFAAKAQDTSGHKVSPVILILTAVAVCACAGIGYYVYQQIAALTVPEQVAVIPASAQPAPAVASQPIPGSTNNTSSTESPGTEGTAKNDPAVSTPINSVNPLTDAVAAADASTTALPAVPAAKPRWVGKTGEADLRPMVRREPVLKADLPATFGEVPATGKAGQLQISTGHAESPVNLALAEAYRALMAGDDARAQSKYRQIVQSDPRNVDAMLGLAALAVRQDRLNDAAGWYGKVLELAPRQPQAQAGLLGLQSQADPVGSESRLKSLIVQQPGAAHLHAALGDVYAEQNRWNDAQQAYFQAYHHDPRNSQYAFNLAVSLEQIGKPALALPYYETASSLLPEVGGQINRGQLEQRIQQLRAASASLATKP